MPVGRMHVGESPTQPVPCQASLDVRIGGDVEIVVEIEEAQVNQRQINRQRGEHQQAGDKTGALEVPHLLHKWIKCREPGAQCKSGVGWSPYGLRRIQELTDL